LEAERARILAAAAPPASEQAIIPASRANLAPVASATPIAHTSQQTFPERPKKLARPKYFVNDQGTIDLEKVPQATGVKPHPETQHDWGNDPQDPRNKNFPDWLNDNGGQQKTCRVCGVTERRDLIRVDRKGMNYHYVDAYGIAITSLVPLNCPTFLGDVPGAVAEAKGRIRNLDTQMEQVHYRMEALEQQNMQLQAQLDAKIQLDVTGFVNWLSSMTALSATAQIATTPVDVAGLPYEVPTPIADLLQGIATVREPVTIDLQFEEEELAMKEPK